MIFKAVYIITIFSLFSILIILLIELYKIWNPPYNKQAQEMRERYFETEGGNDEGKKYSI